MNFELTNLFTCLTQNPSLEKLDVMRSEAFSVLFSKIMNDTVGTEAKMDICFIKNDSSVLALLQQYERTTLNNICRQSVKLSNIVLLLIT